MSSILCLLNQDAKVRNKMEIFVIRYQVFYFFRGLKKIFSYLCILK